MFAETKKYKNNGHFFFKKGDKLAEESKDVPELPGVYYVIRLARGKIDLVYIGKSGAMAQSGKFKEQLRKEIINNQEIFDNKMATGSIDGLDIYWFVTMDKTNHDLPGYVEGLLMQRYFEVHGELPEWNKEY